MNLGKLKIVILICKIKKELLNSVNLELPDTPEIKDFKKIMIKRDEKIKNEIIKPKDELIQKLYKENVSMHKELSLSIKEFERKENELEI